MKCNKPPAGWWCSLPYGHDGACAARPIDSDYDAAYATKLLEQFVDLSVKIRGKRLGQSVFRQSFLESEAFCLFCGDTANLPPQVRHKDGCIVVQAQAFLRR